MKKLITSLMLATECFGAFAETPMNRPADGFEVAIRTVNGSRGAAPVRDRTVAYHPGMSTQHGA